MLITVNHHIMSMQSQIIKNNILIKQINDQKLDFHYRFSENIHVQNNLVSHFSDMFTVEIFNIINDFNENNK